VELVRVLAVRAELSERDWRKLVRVEMHEPARLERGDPRIGHAGDGETVDIRFGDQLHTRVLAGAQDGRVLNPAQVAAHVAK
jgi:hypothetical protein